MKPSLLTLLCLLPFIGMAWIAYVAVQRRREWKERDRVYEFWSRQCQHALIRMEASLTNEEYERWNATMRVNMRRYEREVLGR